MSKTETENAGFLREGVKLLAGELMDLEVSQHLGAERYERTGERRGHRNGTRERQWDTRVGTIELSVPRVRDTSSFPSLLQPLSLAEQALVAVVQEAYIHGVSTQRVDDLVQALRMTGTKKSRVSHLYQSLDAKVERFRTRAIEGLYTCPWLDAAFRKVRTVARRNLSVSLPRVATNSGGENER